MAKILLVDDDRLMVKMYQGKFEDDGYDVEVTINGEEGLVKTLEFKPDLILLDIMMPKVNGLQMLTILKEKDQTKKIPVILLTNVGGEEDAENGLNLGAVAYLIKAHYDVKDIVKKVKEVLGGYVRELPKVEVEIKSEQDRSDENKTALKEVEKVKEELEKATKKAEKAADKLDHIS
jgi:DNA-binding response OmpR family regulator